MSKKYQVFVSSTFTDLIEERQAAVEAILRCGHIPAGMELFSAGDESQLEVIKRWIDESDIYMLILGGRYGSIEPSTGLSYTEIEYDYAMSQSKPFFAVVLSEDANERKFRVYGSDFMEKDEPKKLAAFRAKVLRRISGFVDDVKDIKLHVTNSIHDLAKRYSLQGWVKADLKQVQDAIASAPRANIEGHPHFELVDSFPKDGVPITRGQMRKMFLKFSNPINRLTACYIGVSWFRQPQFSQWDMFGGIQYAEENTRLIWRMPEEFFQQAPAYSPFDDECYRFEIHIGRGHPDASVKDIYGNTLPQIIIPVWIKDGS